MHLVGMTGGPGLAQPASGGHHTAAEAIPDLGTLAPIDYFLAIKSGGGWVG